MATEHANVTSYDVGKLSQWKGQGKIFAIRVNDEALYPDYAFDFRHHLRPYPALALIIKILSEKKDEWGMAYWFASDNGWLGGARPQDMLAIEPARVVDAARIEAVGIMHC
jgi:hypothetical protein